MLRSVSYCSSCHQRTISRSSADTADEESPRSLNAPKLGMAGVANLFVRARRAESRLPSRQQDQQPKPGQIIFTSGEPRTHPAVESCLQPDQSRFPIEFVESYVCSGGVNIVPLLVATRTSLLDRAEVALGTDTLTDEQWECIITESKSPSSGIYKVEVRYMACATNSSARNPMLPVCIEEVSGIPGLMTILKRCVK